ncbi:MULTISPECIES: phosphopentomutase [Peptostreptococcus]|uniref:Phosphopentomutase n=2 Tax=Peptostreptococcus anaerobius TaxID=1261 RepID=A0A379CE94_9FIRM|nr:MULTISPECIES: phosphopentomutase [Peptostreptococcus]EKX91010.1 phosphopentomutase [Peptostreptococcus anaerobius VPI 4330 = DSM 2949]MBS5595517.1 phosphopentomutase [Peptostreptococcus sp.]MDB8820854.1 phosphopentomutase [Peptostreptococcus anaerobius]MDB8825761.1 phosphopentomutase [Peptostreptococcus anaerobius]MDB8827430.1 phosphopentomutase [Peptostreptococcus anaerobius]
MVENINKIKRVFLIVLDSFGIGELEDAADYGDEGSNTLAAIVKSDKFKAPNLQKLGLFNIEGVDHSMAVEKPLASFARLKEMSKGKDTTIGHWEIAGIVSNKPHPTFPNGFPKDFLEEFSKRTGRGYLCNMPYSGTAVIERYGQEHMKTGDLIVYTSADSVFQIAAHEEVVSLDELYRYCEIARELLKGDDLGVGRVIARPFVGEPGNFTRTPNRHDYSLVPPKKTVMDELLEEGKDSIGVGKIYDIFAGKGIAQTHKMKNNEDGMNITIDLMDKDFEGMCFTNLVDFDMKFGHRNDIDGYANATTEFDLQLGQMMDKMRDDDLLILTADHGCDPSTPSTDHSREHVPMLAYGKMIKEGIDLGTRTSFSDIAKTISEAFSTKGEIEGNSFYKNIVK